MDEYGVVPTFWDVHKDANKQASRGLFFNFVSFFFPSKLLYS